MTTDVSVSHLRKLFDIRPHQFRAQRTIHADTQQREMRNRIPKRFDTLPRNKSRSRSIKRPGCHDRDHDPRFVEITIDREQTGFQIKRVDHCFRQQNIDACLDERFDLLVIGAFHFLKCCAAKCRVVDVG